jgi:hypothetical protein
VTVLGQAAGSQVATQATEYSLGLAGRSDRVLTVNGRSQSQRARAAAGRASHGRFTQPRRPVASWGAPTHRVRLAAHRGTVTGQADRDRDHFPSLRLSAAVKLERLTRRAGSIENRRTTTGTVLQSELP